MRRDGRGRRRGRRCACSARPSAPSTSCTGASAAWCRRSPAAPTSSTCCPSSPRRWSSPARSWQELDGVAVTTTPGLIGALLIGVTAAKALSWALELPLLAANHLHEHIYAAWLGDRAPSLPAVSLVVSGGHTSLFLTEGPLEHLPLGGTVDDAAGEAFDKVANILRLPLPRRAVHRPGGSGRQPARRRLPPELARAGQRRLQLQRPEDGRPLPLPGHQPDARGHRVAQATSRSSSPTWRPASRRPWWTCWRARRSARWSGTGRRA